MPNVCCRKPARVRGWAPRSEDSPDLALESHSGRRARDGGTDANENGCAAFSSEPVTARRPWLLASRRRVVIALLALLALLDLGRSIFARVGYARPLSVWQPDPKVYADLTWPPGADLPADTPAGQPLYARHCAVCHGPDGRGNGPAAPSLIPRPRDFTIGQFKYKTTPAGQLPSESDLIRTVREGLHASAMPYFGDLLSETEIRGVVAYVRSLSPSSRSAPEAALTVPPRLRDDAESRARGAKLYQSQRCADRKSVV